MNCKPGDIAIVVRTGKYTTGMLDKIIRVIARGPDVSRVPGLDLDITATWVYEPILKSDFGSDVLYANDSCLRPINGGPIDAKENDALFSTNPIVRKEPA
jgi:hypothetical protein